MSQKRPKNDSALAAAEARWLKANTAGATAVLPLLYSEAMLPSGFFLKKKPPCKKLPKVYVWENRPKAQHFRCFFGTTIAVLPLLYSEAMPPSGFFLKKKPPCTRLATVRVWENRSKVVPCYKAFPNKCFPQSDWLIPCNDPNAIALQEAQEAKFNFVAVCRRPFARLRVALPGRPGEPTVPHCCRETDRAESRSAATCEPGCGRCIR